MIDMLDRFVQLLMTTASVCGAIVIAAWLFVFFVGTAVFLLLCGYAIWLLVASF